MILVLMVMIGIPVMIVWRIIVMIVENYGDDDKYHYY